MQVTNHLLTAMILQVGAKASRFDFCLTEFFGRLSNGTDPQKSHRRRIRRFDLTAISYIWGAIPSLMAGQPMV